jgi:hypothetical protein
MNNQEKVKAAVEKLLEAEKTTATLKDIQMEAEKAHNVAIADEGKARLEVARQIHNVCPGKDVVYKGRVYARMDSGCLHVKEWDGVVLL